MISDNLREKLIGKWMGIRIAEEAVKVHDVSELMQINRDQVKAHFKTHLGNYEDEDMGNIHVGDVVTNNDDSSKTGMGKGLMTTMLLGALAGGSGLGYFAPMLMGGGGSGDSSAVSPDLDTRYILGLGEPDKPETEREIPKREREDSGRGHSGFSGTPMVVPIDQDENP